MKKYNFTEKELKKIPPKTLLKVINFAKNKIKKDQTMIDVFNQFDVDIEEIDVIPTFFKEMDVSAKTDHGIVWLNFSLLKDGFDKMDFSYLVHEYTHWLQQTSGDAPTQGADTGSYLDNPFEQEGFQNQIKYISDHFGDEEAEEYVRNLLSHHDVEEKEHEDKKEILMAKI